MISLSQVTEVATSVVHTITSWMVIAAHLFSSDPIGIIGATLLAIGCMVVTAIVSGLCLLGQFKLREYFHKQDQLRGKDNHPKLQG